MAVTSPNLPSVSPDNGFTCQCWLKTEIDRLCYSVPWIWFSTNFGAWQNVDSSNPCLLYYNLSRAVHQHDAGSRIVHHLRAQMLATIRGSSLSATDKRALRKFVVSASLAQLRPEIWRLDLNTIAVNRGLSLGAAKQMWTSNAQAQVSRNPHQSLQPDEYLIQDLQPSSINLEYEVIVES